MMHGQNIHVMHLIFNIYVLELLNLSADINKSLERLTSEDILSLYHYAVCNYYRHSWCLGLICGHYFLIGTGCFP